MTYFPTTQSAVRLKLTVAYLLIFSLGLTGCASSLRIPTLHYFVPKKEFTANVTYTMVVRKDYKKFVPKKSTPVPAQPAKKAKPASNGKPAVAAVAAVAARSIIVNAQVANLIRARVMECTIASAADVVIVPRLVPAEQRVLRIPEKFFKGKTKVGVVFDANAPGFIGSVNTEQTPATAEVISGIGEIVGSVVGTAAKILAGKAKLADAPEDSTVYQTVKFQRMHNITSIFTSAANVVTIALSVADINGNTGQTATNAQCALQVQEPCLLNTLPQLIFTATALAPAIVPLVAASMGAVTVSSTAVYYRLPAFYKLQVDLFHDGLTPKQQIIETVYNVPQQGIIDSIAVGARSRWKGRHIVVAKFDNTAGTLAEYSVETEGQLSSSLTKSGAALSQVGTSVQGLQNLRTSRNEQLAKDIDAENAVLKAQQDREKLRHP